MSPLVIRGGESVGDVGSGDAGNGRDASSVGEEASGIGLER